MADYADKLEMLDYFDAEVGPNKTILNDQRLYGQEKNIINIR